jgi:hypothetical protein
MQSPAATLDESPDHSSADPSLTSLIIGTSLAVILSAYWLFDTYMVRQAAPQTLSSGKSYVARIPASRLASPSLKTGGERLIAAINQAKELAVTLRQTADSVSDERASQENDYRKQMAALDEQSARAERLIDELMREIEALPRTSLAGDLDARNARVVP